jgi:hypothetical protein
VLQLRQSSCHSGAAVTAGRRVMNDHKHGLGTENGPKKSMTDDLQLTIFAAVIAAFVVCGCLATRAPKRRTETGQRKA